MDQKSSNVFYTRTPANKIWGQPLTYTIPRAYYNALFKDGERKDPQKAIDYLNETEGLLGTIVELHLEN